MTEESQKIENPATVSHKKLGNKRIFASDGINVACSSFCRSTIKAEAAIDNEKNWGWSKVSAN
jgi:hypothetical protein